MTENLKVTRYTDGYPIAKGFDDGWTQLTDYLGGTDVAGGKMK